jgi:hypothetical protein
MSVSQITPTVASTWRSRAGDTPAALGALYRDAAQRIRTCGYDAAVGGGDFYQGHKGVSVQVALRQAAETYYQDNYYDAADLAEELENRLAAVLYLTGQLTQRTSIHDLPNQVAAWESDLPPVEGSWPIRYRWHTQDEALAVLETAAALFGTLCGAS